MGYLNVYILKHLYRFQRYESIATNRPIYKFFIINPLNFIFNDISGSIIPIMFLIEGLRNLSRDDLS